MIKRVKYCPALTMKVMSPIIGEYCTGVAVLDQLLGTTYSEKRFGRNRKFKIDRLERNVLKLYGRLASMKIWK